MSVKDVHPDYKANAAKWKRCRDVVSGTDAVKGAGEAYLPRLKEQSPDGYKGYVMRATFYNATARTVSGLIGMLFRKPPKIDVPEGIKSDLDDIDMKGEPFTMFAQDVADEAMTVGRVGILVDFPTVKDDGEPMTVARAATLGLRPMMEIYKAENILNWKLRRVNNKTLLALVVLQEQMRKPKDDFNDDVSTVYRVLDLDAFGYYRVRIFTVGPRSEDVLLSSSYPTMNGKFMSAIPFFVVGTDDIKIDDIDEPPLLDLVDINLAHYRVSADYEHGCHFTGLPTPVISGYTPGKDEAGVVIEKFYIGSESAWVFPDVGAKAEYLEFKAGGLSELSKNLDRKEQQMAILGARMIAAEKKTAETATTAAIHRTGENSVLASISVCVSLALKKALIVFAQWAGVEETSVEFEINRDFMPATVDAQMLQAWLKSLQSGSISYETFYDLLQRGDLVASEKSASDEQGQIAKDGNQFKPAPALTPPPGNNSQPSP